MKLRAYRIWLSAIPAFFASLLLPVTRDGWLDGPFEVHGMLAAWWLPFQSITATAILIGYPSVARIDDWWFQTSYGIVIVLVALSPVFIFSRVFGARHKIGRILCLGQILLFTATFLGPLLWSENRGLPFQFIGYWAFGVGLLILSIAYIFKIKEVEQCDPPNGYPRHASC